MTESRELFANRPINAASLPDYREAELGQVVRAFLPHKMLTSGIFWLMLLGASLIVPRLPGLDVDLPAQISLVLLALLLANQLHAILDARHRGWALREHDLIYQSGVVFRKLVVLPFARIQHVETLSGPIERAFGLMRVKCFTAGGLSADLVVEGLDHETAIRVRQYLLEQIRDDRSEQEQRTSADQDSDSSTTADPKSAEPDERS